MRGRTETLDPQSTGNWVSAQYLETLLELRAQELVDLPGTPLFFGRLDYADAGARGVDTDHDVAGEVFHIGRRHVADDQGRPLVIDWRAPVSVPFYRASPRVPMGVDLRRRFAFTGGDLTGFEDEPLTGPTASTTGPGVAHPHRRDRTTPCRPDARHRRHHPARAGRDRARRPRHLRLRAGRARHRQDGGRAAPGRVPALRPPRPVAPAAPAGDRPERRVPALHRRRAAGTR